MRPIELMKSAYEKKLIKTEFKIPLDDGKFLDAVLTAPDIYSILEVQEEVYQERYAILREKGMHNLPINEDDWDKELKSYKPKAREQAAADPPQNLAEQVARKSSRLRTVQELLPMFLKDKQGRLLFETTQERAEFKEFLCSQPQLMNLLAEKYLELTTKILEVTETTKNSNEPEGSESGKPENASPAATAAIPFSRGSKRR